MLKGVGFPLCKIELQTVFAIVYYLGSNNPITPVTLATQCTVKQTPVTKKKNRHCGDLLYMRLLHIYVMTGKK